VSVAVLVGGVLLFAWACCAMSSRQEREYERCVLAQWQRDHDRQARGYAIPADEDVERGA
jgi:hypothetical protein